MAATNNTNTTASASSMKFGINPMSLLVNHPKILHFSWIQGQTLGSSPQFLTLTVLFYLFFTLFLSQNRIFSLEPHLRRRITVLHNLVLIVLSFTMAVGSLLSIFCHAPTLQHVICYPKNTQPKGPLFFWAYVFYLSKIYEYIDTLLILLNDSIKQPSFLHVYHHAVVVIVCYLALHTSESSFPLAVATNASVHVLMYSYYLLSALGFRPKWKRLVTVCQILQFSCGVVYLFLVFCYHLVTSGCSGIWACLFTAIFGVTLLHMFTDFYAKNYSTKNVDKNKLI